MSNDDVQVSIEDVQAHLSERGKLELDLATARAINQKLAQIVKDLQAQLSAQGKTDG